MNGIIKAFAFLLWADERIEPSEIDKVKVLLSKYGLEEEGSLKQLDEIIEDFVDEGEENDEEDDEGDFSLSASIGAIDIGPKVDPYEFLEDLCALACSDGLLGVDEVTMLHELAKAMNLEYELVTLALVKLILKGSLKVQFKDA